jgi:hypothetical protein
MRELVTGAQRRRNRDLLPRDLTLARRAPAMSAQRVAIVFCLAAGFVLSSSAAAPAMTLRLAFPDGQPMTYGSACSGQDCLLRGPSLAMTDAEGEVRLAPTSDRIVEYRREGIDLTLAPFSSASGQAKVDGERATVVFPRVLQSSAPAVDSAEWDVAARINEERGALGLAPAQLNVRLSAAADLQATWLSSSAVGLALPLLSHIGPFGSSIDFRLAEVSFPEPRSGAEIASAGMTPAEAVTHWLLSKPHRDVLLAPGELLIGVGQVGSVIIVDTHEPCFGCAPAADGSAGAPAGNSGSGGSTALLAPGTSGASGASGAPSRAPGSTGGRAPSCGAEKLRVTRLRDRRRRLRLRVSVGCLRSGSGYTLAVLQRPSRRNLTNRRIAGAGALTLALRPARNASALRVKLKRNGRAVAARTVSARLR